MVSTARECNTPFLSRVAMSIVSQPINERQQICLARIDLLKQIIQLESIQI